MEKIIRFYKRRTLNKDVGLGKKSKFNKSRAYVYSGLQSIASILISFSNLKTSRSVVYTAFYMAYGVGRL